MNMKVKSSVEFSKFINKVLKDGQIELQSFSFSDISYDFVRSRVFEWHARNPLPVIEETLGEGPSLGVASEYA